MSDTFTHFKIGDKFTLPVRAPWAWNAIKAFLGLPVPVIRKEYVVTATSDPLTYYDQVSE